MFFAAFVAWFVMVHLSRFSYALKLYRQLPLARLNPKSRSFMGTIDRTLDLSELPPKIEGIRREDFPVLTNVKPANGKPFIFLDSAASSQKPKQVIEAMNSYYRTTHANVHRGAYSIANKATEMFENARSSVQRFINAKHHEDIVFTRGATEAINLVALSYGQRFQPGDEIILSVMEHHSNLVPWQMLAQRTGAILKFVPLSPEMTFDYAQYESLLSAKTKIVAVAHVSNVLGTINPIDRIVGAAHRVGAAVLVDACQSVPHMPINVQALDVDFLVASGHKMCGPTGIGFLYGKRDLLNAMPPVYGGGEMIETVSFESSTYAPAPARFEAGTPAIAEAIGLGAACEYLQTIGMQRIMDHEHQLCRYLYEQLASIPELTLYGPGRGHPRGGLVAFNAHHVHAADLSFFLDQDGVAVRTGHHCAQPLHGLLGAAGSVRASLYFYNNQDDVDGFVSALRRTLMFFEELNMPSKSHR